MSHNDIGMLLKQIYDAKEKIANEMLREFDLTYSQFRIMLYVYDKSNAKVSFKEIEKEFSLTQQTVAGILKRLEAKGLIQSSTDESDKRVKNLVLTEKGKESYAKAMANYLKSQDLITQGLSIEDQAVLKRMLEIVLKNLRQQ